MDIRTNNSELMVLIFQTGVFSVVHELNL